MRLTGLNTTLYNLAGTSYLGTFEDVSVTVAPTKVDGRGAAERYGKPCTVLRAASIQTGLMRDGANCRITNLDVSALLIGAASVKPQYQGGTLRFNNTILEAEGGSDEWFYGQVESTDFGGSLDLMVESTGFDPLALARGALAGTNTTVTYTAGTGGGIVLPVTLGDVTKSAKRGDMQMFSVAFDRGGAPTSVGTGLPLFALGLVGSAECAYSIANGMEPYAGNALIESGELTFGRGQIEKQSYRLRVQGPLTLAS